MNRKISFATAILVSCILCNAEAAESILWERFESRIEQVERQLHLQLDDLRSATNERLNRIEQLIADGKTLAPSIAHKLSRLEEVEANHTDILLGLQSREQAIDQE